ncbi:hypothetical protein Nepgr_015344 [Nepenthes gracilis]|uniref:Pentatricopeptide repeat-containing protein n=1 Tax=Nepenthes gracilis TaxID=150966 RepID=A0AAD3SKY0_NEPGR|nr:hypothetical protein Nepgr_015344 [Nepenthes gracilis]
MGFNVLSIDGLRDSGHSGSQRMHGRGGLEAQAFGILESDEDFGLVPTEGKILESSKFFRDMQIDDHLGLPRSNLANSNQKHEGFSPYIVYLRSSLFNEGKIPKAENLSKKMDARGYSIKTVTCNIVVGGPEKGEADQIKQLRLLMGYGLMDGLLLVT